MTYPVIRPDFTYRTGTWWVGTSRMVTAFGNRTPGNCDQCRQFTVAGDLKRLNKHPERPRYASTTPRWTEGKITILLLFEDILNVLPSEYGKLGRNEAWANGFRANENKMLLFTAIGEQTRERRIDR